MSDIKLTLDTPLEQPRAASAQSTVGSRYTWAESNDTPTTPGDDPLPGLPPDQPDTDPGVEVHETYEAGPTASTGVGARHPQSQQSLFKGQ